MLSPAAPHTFNGVPDSTDTSPAPILMTPLQLEPASDLPASPSEVSPPTTFQPPAANPFPRAITTDPELPSLTPNPYSNPGLMPVPGSSLPTAPQPQLSPGVSVPLDPPPSLDLPTPRATTREPLSQPTLNFGSTRNNGPTGTGITLPPRRATSVTSTFRPGRREQHSACRILCSQAETLVEQRVLRDQPLLQIRHQLCRYQTAMVRQQRPVMQDFL